MSEGGYLFAANAGESTGRFEIVYQPETVLATDGVVREDLVVYRDGSDFVVKAETNKITDLQVFDMNGRLLLKLQPKTTKAIIPATMLTKGMYVLKVDQGGVITSRKIIK